MQHRTGLPAAALLGITIALAQTPPAQEGATPTPAGRGARGNRETFPNQQRPPDDPQVVARGKAAYGINCTGCHGADLRGGDMGGPNLLRSQVIFSDKDGELIRPIIEGSRQASGMPAVPLGAEDLKAVVTYLHNVLATLGRQGSPPEVGMPVTSILVGDAAAGQAFFDARCASCHSPTGDLKGLGTRISDPKMLQNAWVAGSRGGRGGRGGGSGAPVVTVKVTPPSGEAVEGQLVRIDDFLVTLRLADDSLHTFRRDGDVPKVEVRDPMKGHRDLLPVYTDKNMHDVTAYLVTLK